MTRNNWFNFVQDPNPDPDLIIFYSDSSPLRDRAKPIYNRISQNVVDRFGRNLVVCDKEELIQFWGRSESGSGYENYLILK